MVFKPDLTNDGILTIWNCHQQRK